MAKKVVKKQKKTSKVKNILLLARSHKLIVFLLFLVLLFPASFAYEKYRDWDNAQMIKGLSRDFPELVEQIEQATQLDLELKSNCMTTTEKFSGGVRTCEFAVGYVGLDNAEQVINKELDKSNKFSKFTNFINNKGQKFNYRNKEACDVGYVEKERFRIECITAVRENNINLAKELLNR
jgi:hypothetical protein